MTENLTAFVGLFEYLTFYGVLTNTYRSTRQSVLLLDWDKAMRMPLLKRPRCGTEAWRLTLRVGMNKELILDLVDPAIRNITKRLLDLPIITTSSCSAHPHDPQAYITMLFTDENFGREFVAVYRSKGLKGIEFQLNGISPDVFGPLGPNISIDHCLEYKLPMTFGCDTAAKGPEKCLTFWRVFSEVIDNFDHQGVEEIDEQLLLESVPHESESKKLRQVHRKITEAYRDFLGGQTISDWPLT